MIYKKHYQKEMLKYINSNHKVHQSIEDIISRLETALVIAETMKNQQDNTQKLEKYKEIFHSNWIGIAEPYNNLTYAIAQKNKGA